MGFAEDAVKRFYKTLVNSLIVLLKEGTVKEDTTIEELLNFCRKKKGE